MFTWNYIQRQVIEGEQISVSAEEAKAEAKELAAAQFAQYGMPNAPEEMLENFAKNILENKEQSQKIYEKLYEQKVVESVRSKVKVTEKAISAEDFAELAKISKEVPYTTFSYDTVVDALAEIGREVESDQIIVMGLDAKAEVRKDADYKASRQGEILYTGQFGDICGIPCVASKLVPAGTVYVTAKDAVKFFVKKSGSVEQDRDIETKDNTVVYERHGLMALVDETKSIKLTKKA
jgi:hypothetical protein